MFASTSMKRRRTSSPPAAQEPEPRPGSAHPPSPAAPFGGREPSPVPLTENAQPRALPERHIDIDDDGDLLLVVGDDNVETVPTVFRVDSRALCRASPAWKSMLCGGFAEAVRPTAASGDPWVVKLPDDSAEAMHVLLGIAHGIFHHVPDEELTGKRVSVVYDLTVASDKYDLAPLLRPWARSWTAMRLRRNCEQSCKNKPENTGFVFESLQKCLWVMWELGNRGEFERLAMELAWCCRYDDTIDSLWCRRLPGSGSPAELYLFDKANEPFEALEIISQTRLRVIHRLLLPLLTWVDRLMASFSDEDDAMIGTTMRALKRCQLWPLPQRDAYTGSIYQLVASLTNMAAVLGGASQYPRLCDKMGEISRHVEGILQDKADDNLKTILFPSQVKHLETQGRKTGLKKK